MFLVAGFPEHPLPFDHESVSMKRAEAGAVTNADIVSIRSLCIIFLRCMRTIGIRPVVLSSGTGVLIVVITSPFLYCWI